MKIKIEARRLQKLLQRKDLKIVFAESCTGGLVSATLASLPGISNHLCGSFVVYREDSKMKWLHIPKSELRIYSPVSRQITRRLANQALRFTPEANLSAAVTGHLGPNAPRNLDGRIFIAVSRKIRGKIICNAERQFTLPNITQSVDRNRSQRQVLASHQVLFLVRSLLEDSAFLENQNSKREGQK